MIPKEEKPKINEYDTTFENDMVKEWLDHSNETTRHFPKPTFDRYTVEFVMYSCKNLEVEREVFFMATDVIGKYLNIAKEKNIEIKDPILTALVLILICNKHTGQRSDLSGSTILTFLRKVGLKKYNLYLIQNTEKTIMINLRCHIPLLSTMDDMNVLIEVFVKPDQFIELIRRQCLEMLNLFYLNSKTIIETLEEVYSKNKKTKVLLNTLCERNLYFPAGILISVLKISENINLFDYKTTSYNVSNYTNVPVDDLNLLSSVICKLFRELRKRQLNITK